MVPKVLQLTDEQAEGLERLARARGVTVDEMIQGAVQKLLQPLGLLATDERRRRALAASGLYDFGVTDLAENHDKYLAEAYES